MIKVFVVPLALFVLCDGQLDIKEPRSSLEFEDRGGGGGGGGYIPPDLQQPKLRPQVPKPQPAITVIDDDSPKPYAFSYDNTDEYGTRLTREESGDESGTVRGSYSYRNAAGLYRIVTYIADQNGYRATVNSNKPGLIPHNPADVTYNVLP